MVMGEASFERSRQFMALDGRSEAKRRKSREKLGKDRSRWLLLKKGRIAEQKYRHATLFEYPFLQLFSPIADTPRI